MASIHSSGCDSLNWNLVFCVCACGVWVRTEVTYLIHEVGSLSTHLLNRIPSHPIPTPTILIQRECLINDQTFVSLWQIDWRRGKPASADKELKRAKNVMNLGQKNSNLDQIS